MPNDLNNATWSDVDASNTSASPNGFPAGTTGTQDLAIGRQMMGGLKRFWNRINGTVTSTGSANAYVYTPVNASFPIAYVTGERYCFKANFANTGAATLNINGLGAKNIFKQSPSGPTALTGAEIQSGQMVDCVYDGTQFQIIATFPVIASRSLAKSGTAVSAPADTTEDTLATITVPANAIGANGVIKYTLNLALTNNANVKTLRVRFSGAAGTVLGSANLAGEFNVFWQGTIFNANATNAQNADAFYVANPAAAISLHGTSAIDTTAATTIVITGQKATAGDTFTLSNYLFELVADGA